MPVLSMEVFEQAGLEVAEIDVTAKIKALNANFTSRLTAEDGFYGRIDGFADIIKQQTGWSDEIANAISSPEEYMVLKDAGLKEYDIGGKKYLFKSDMDWNQLDEFGRTNTERVKNNLNPIAKNGDKLEYHHLGQGKNAPIAELTWIEHDQVPVDTKTPSEVRPDGNNTEWNKQKRQILKSREDAVLVQKSAFQIAVKAGHETGLQSGLSAARITAVISTVDNVRSVLSGEVSAQEAFIDVAKDTGAAAAIGYGTGFISSSVASATQASSHALIRTLGKANVAAAAISFGIDSYDSVVDFAQGNINGTELAINLGESVVGVAGTTAGSSIGAAAGSVVPVVGTIAGGLVGGMVGYAIATGAYATAIEAVQDGTEVIADKAVEIYTASNDFAVESVLTATNAADAIMDSTVNTGTTIVESAEVLKAKAVEMGQGVIDMVANSAPEAVDSVKTAMNSYAANLGISFNL